MADECVMAAQGAKSQPCSHGPIVRVRDYDPDQMVKAAAVEGHEKGAVELVVVEFVQIRWRRN